MWQCKTWNKSLHDFISGCGLIWVMYSSKVHWLVAIIWLFVPLISRWDTINVNNFNITNWGIVASMRDAVNRMSYQSLIVTVGWIVECVCAAADETDETAEFPKPGLSQQREYNCLHHVWWISVKCYDCWYLSTLWLCQTWFPRGKVCLTQASLIICGL